VFGGRSARANLLLLLGASFTVLALATAFTASRDEQPMACGLDLGDSVRLSSYEWRESSWRTPEARSELVEAALELCLDRVYVDLTGAATAEGDEASSLVSDVVELSALAEAEGIEIGALAGDPWWPSPQGHVDTDRVLQFVLDLNAHADLIAGLHLDVEPWGLEEWSDSRESLVMSYLRFVSHVEERRTDVGLDTPIAYLVPYWFDGSNGEAPLVTFAGRSEFPYEHVATILRNDASLAVMAYRRQALGAGGIVELVSQELERMTPPVIIAVETAPIDPPSATFAGLDLEVLADELTTVIDRTGVSEIVINDLQYLGKLSG
jgi:hypothetical protein